MATTAAANAGYSLSGSYTTTDSGATITDSLSDNFAPTFSKVGDTSEETLANFFETADSSNKAISVSFTIDGTLFTFDGSETFTTPGNSAHDQITWNESEITKTLSNGAVLEVQLANATYNGALKNYTGLDVPVTFTLESAPTTAVPEPGSLALLASGMIAMGAMLRRKRNGAII